ncbi:MAG: hypothetical protein ACERKO_10235 [Acetanaerobacterium sp.]
MVIKMTGWIILGASLLLLVLLFAQPVRVVMRYDEKLIVTARFLWVSYQLVPGNEERSERQKAKKLAKQQKKDKKQGAKPKQKKKNPVSGLFDKKDLPGLISWVKIALESASGPVKRFIGKMCIVHLCFYMDVAGENAADAAIKTGRMNGYLYSGYALINNFFKKVSEPDVLISPDYYAKESQMYFAGELRVSLAAIVGMVLRFGARLVLRVFAEKRNSQKQNRRTQPTGS